VGGPDDFVVPDHGMLGRGAIGSRPGDVPARV